MFLKLSNFLLILLSVTVLFLGCSSKKHKPNLKPDVIVTPDKEFVQKALIVGVSDYAGEHDLKGINLDVDNMNNLFNSWGFDTVKLSASINFEQKMAEYASSLKAEDVFILYYSGHGSYTPDTSGDEIDGQDELIVLSDGITNNFLLDDKVNILLNNIKARKLIIFDSCNSGSSHKRAIRSKGIDTQIKYIPAPKSARDFAGKNSQVPNTSLGGDYLFFAACRDDEQSLASTNGSLFTNAFVNHVDISNSANSIHQATWNALKDRFNPQLSASNENLKTSTLKSFLKIN